MSDAITENMSKMEIFAVNKATSYAFELAGLTKQLKSLVSLVEDAAAAAEADFKSIDRLDQLQLAQIKLRSKIERIASEVTKLDNKGRKVGGDVVLLVDTLEEFHIPASSVQITTIEMIKEMI